MLAKLAASQYGVVAVWQLLELGFSRREIALRAQSRHFHRVYQGVYAVGHPARTAEAFQMAAVLACGRDAVLSHWTAAARWQLIRPVRGPVHVTAPGDHEARRGMRPHTSSLHPHDCTKRDGIPITSVPRTLLDLGAVADERVLRRAVNQALRGGWFNRRGVEAVMSRNPRRKGSRQLRAVIAAVIPATRRSRSDLEVAFLELCETYGLPTPVVNGKVNGIEVDMNWPGTNLIVELDSYEYHRTPQEFENDRRRDAGLKVAGYEVLRVGEGWLDSDPAGVAETVRTLLGGPG